MSVDSVGTSRSPDSEQNTQPSETKDKASREEQGLTLEEEDWSDGRERDCVICQNAAVNRVLLPCRHACVCDGCVSYFQHCPICRAFVLESFTLTQGLDAEHWLFIINYIITLYRDFLLTRSQMLKEGKTNLNDFGKRKALVMELPKKCHLSMTSLCSRRQCHTIIQLLKMCKKTNSFAGLININGEKLIYDLRKEIMTKIGANWTYLMPTNLDYVRNKKLAKNMHLDNKFPFVLFLKMNNNCD